MSEDTSGGRAPPSPLSIVDVNNVICGMASRSLTDDAQEQLSRVQNVMNWYGPERLRQNHIDALFIAATALSGDQPNILLAQGILWDLECGGIQLMGGFPSKVLERITGGWPMVTVGVGLALVTMLYLIFWFIFELLWRLHELPNILTEGSSKLVTAIFFGMLGSSISILTRINRAVDLQKLNPISLFLNCLFKPLVGATFATLIFFMFEADLFGGILMQAIGTNETKHIFVVSIIGFISGFSERFATDAIAGAEAAGRAA
jgi:hypothetical protein